MEIFKKQRWRRLGRHHARSAKIAGADPRVERMDGRAIVVFATIWLGRSPRLRPGIAQNLRLSIAFRKARSRAASQIIFLMRNLRFGVPITFAKRRSAWHGCVRASKSDKARLLLMGGTLSNLALSLLLARTQPC